MKFPITDIDAEFSNGLTYQMLEELVRRANAFDELLACTRSNEPGQPGSSYAAPPRERWDDAARYRWLRVNRTHVVIYIDGKQFAERGLDERIDRAAEDAESARRGSTTRTEQS